MTLSQPGDDTWIGVYECVQRCANLFGRELVRVAEASNVRFISLIALCDNAHNWLAGEQSNQVLEGVIKLTSFVKEAHQVGATDIQVPAELTFDYLLQQRHLLQI